ncbi:MAG: glycosyltransferase [Bacteroidales bacterium]|jgi:glycosyltransferase involved in cell wall biosynthesis|nr:glycosyltransferase [Bacteroidales bacterium]
MKILFLANKVPWPLKDGGAIGTFSISYGLAKSGCSVDMLAINTPKHHINTEDIPENIRETMSIETISIDTNISALKLVKNLFFSKKPYIAERFYHQEFNNALINKLKSATYDIVILEMLYLSAYIPTIRKHSKAHITMRAPNIEHEIWMQIAKNTKNPIKSYYLKNMAKRIRRIEKQTMNRYDSLIPVSETNAETYKKMGVKVPVFRTTTGVFIDQIPTHPEIDEENALAHIGALDWIPNFEGLSWFVDEVWPLILEEIPNINFYIAGRNAPENTADFFNKKQIHYLGEVPDAYEFLQSKSILIVPLLSGSGMRVKIIEGLALGKSIVSTEIGAEGIALENNVHLKIANEPKAFAEACIQLFKDKKQRESLAQNGKQFVYKEYDNLKIAKSLCDFYKKQVK